MSRWRFKFTILTPWTLLPSNLPEEACKDQAADEFADLLCVRTRSELHKFSFWPRARSEAFLCSSFDAFEERFLRHSEYAVIVLSGSHSTCLDVIYPRLLVFFTMRRSWTNRFLLIFLGNPLNQHQFDTSLLTHAPIVFAGNQEERWSQDRESWEKLLGVLQIEYMSASMEDVGSGARSHCHIGNQWTSVTDLRGRSYAVKITTENASPVTLFPSSWHDLTACGVLAKKSGSFLLSRHDSTPISEPCLVQSQGAYFVPTERARTNSDHVSNTSSPLTRYYSGWSANCASNSTELVVPTIYGGLSVSTGALNSEVSPGYGQHFLRRPYHGAFQSEATDKTDSAALVTDNTSIASEQDEMCLPKPSYFRSKKPKETLTHSERIHKPGTKLRRRLHSGRNHKVKSLEDSLDKPSAFTPIVQRIRSKASELLHFHPKEDKFGKRSRNTLGETLVSLANMSTEIVSRHPTANGIGGAEIIRTSTDLREPADPIGLQSRESTQQIASNFAKLADDATVTVHEMKPQLLKMNCEFSDHASERQKLPQEVKGPSFHELHNHVLAVTQSSALLESSAEKSPNPTSALTCYANTEPKYQRSSKLVVSADAVRSEIVPFHLSHPDAQSQFHRTDYALLEAQRSVNLREKTSDSINSGEKTSEHWNSGGTDNYDEYSEFRVDYGTLNTTPDTVDNSLPPAFRQSGLISLVSACPEGSGDMFGNYSIYHQTEVGVPDDKTHDSSLHSTALAATAGAAICTNSMDSLTTVPERVVVPVLRQSVYGSIPFREGCGIVPANNPLFPKSAVEQELRKNLDDHYSSQSDSSQLPETDASSTNPVNTIDDTNMGLMTMQHTETGKILTGTFDNNSNNSLPVHVELMREMARQPNASSEYGNGVYRDVSDARRDPLIPSMKMDEVGTTVIEPSVVMSSIMHSSQAILNVVPEKTSNPLILAADEESQVQLMNKTDAWNANAHSSGLANVATASIVDSNEDALRPQDDHFILPPLLCSAEKTERTIDIEPTRSTHSTQPEQDGETVISLPSNMMNFQNSSLCSSSMEPVHFQGSSNLLSMPSIPSTDMQQSPGAPIHLSTTSSSEPSLRPDHHPLDFLCTDTEAQEIKNSNVVSDCCNSTVTLRPAPCTLSDYHSVLNDYEAGLSLMESETCSTTALPSDDQHQSLDSGPGVKLSAKKHFSTEIPSEMRDGRGESTVSKANHVLTPSTFPEDSSPYKQAADECVKKDVIVSNRDSENTPTSHFELPLREKKIGRPSWFEWCIRRLPLSTLILADDLDVHIVEMEISMIKNDFAMKERDLQLNLETKIVPDTHPSLSKNPPVNAPEMSHTEENDNTEHGNFSWYSWFSKKLSSSKRTGVQIQETPSEDSTSKIGRSPADCIDIKDLSDSHSFDQISETNALRDEEIVTPHRQTFVTRLPVEQYHGSDTVCTESKINKDLDGELVCLDQKVDAFDQLPDDNHVERSTPRSLGSLASAVYFADRGLHLAICWSLIQNALRNPFCVATIFVAFTSASSRIRQWPLLLDQLSGICDVYLFTPPSRSDRPGLSYWCQWISSTRPAVTWRGRATITNFLQYPWSLINPAD